VEVHVRRRPTLAIAFVGALGVVLALSACGRPDQPVEAAVPVSTAAPTTAEATTTSAPPPPSFPLTGLPLPEPGSADHPAVVVKMDNSADARPQSGINEADVVYELLVEGITRYALVFHSQAGDPVGPVRSARSSDVELVANLARPLIGWSGANPGVGRELRTAIEHGFLVDAGVDASGEYFRERTRKAPHNLYTNVSALRASHAPPDAGAPDPVFSYREPGQPYEGGSESMPGMAIGFTRGVTAEYVWDPERNGWDRFQVDHRHGRADSATVDAAGAQVAPQNVVIMFLHYGVSSADARSPLAHSTGEGEAIVLTDGKAIRGRWTRENPLFGWSLVDGTGNPIELTPGRTWVALPPVGSAATPLGPETAGELLSFRR
jgi:hypothetical protein